MARQLRSRTIINKQRSALPTNDPGQANTTSEFASRSTSSYQHSRDGDGEDSIDNVGDQDTLTNSTGGQDYFEGLPNARKLSPEDSVPAASPKSGRGKAKKQRKPTTGSTQKVTVPKRDIDTWKYKNGLCTKLTPIHNIEDIIGHMVSNSIAGLREVLDYLGGHILRVATLCSGTESPILFLRELSTALAEQGHTFQFEHVFSAEIEPFKQAYIERNFHPPLLFRDITQFVIEDEPDTAFGSKAKLPDNVDLLVAGFSCVDFSNLNAHKKSLEDNGQSGQTARGVLRYAVASRVPLVILENVLNAPWDKIGEMWTDAGYATKKIKLDTKEFYIPHTRLRGYMLCVLRSKISRKDELNTILKEWKETIKRLKRPASTPFHAFLLDTDDPRLHKAQAEYKSKSKDKGKREFAWVRYEARHSKYRQLNGFGHGRPITEWRSNGSSSMIEFGNRLWMENEVERVKDTLDISALRCAARGYDLHSKSAVIDFSQGVDRQSDTHPAGLVGCITPSGMPYYTLRGGLITGIEALRLQGIPINELSLTRESQKELQNMAGNAMSTPVIGAAIIASLILGLKTLPCSSNPERTILPSPFPIKSKYDLLDADEFQLLKRTVSTHSFDVMQAESLMYLAADTASRCQCEGPMNFSNRIFFVCKECGHTACRTCRGTPRHDFEEIKLTRRSDPLSFKEKLGYALPMQLTMKGFTEDLDLHVEQSEALATYLQTVRLSVNHELRFSEIKRSQIWTIVYVSPSSRLELRISPSCCQWYYFALPDKAWQCDRNERKLLEIPAGRLIVKGQDLLAGQWKFRWPVTNNVDIVMHQKRGTRRVPSWLCKLGIPKNIIDRVPVEIIVSTNGRLPEIEGDYVRLPECGTACACLYIQKSATQQPMRLFLDPDFLGDPEEDRFVFSLNSQRLIPGQSRHVVASIPNRNFTQWLLTDVTQKTFNGRIEQVWLKTRAKLTSLERVILVKTPTHTFDLLQGLSNIDSEHCAGRLTPVLTCVVPDVVTNRGAWKPGPWLEVTETREHEVFTSIAWIMSRCAKLGHMFEAPRKSSARELGSDCLACSPPPARLKWKYNGLGYEAFEHPLDAAKFESAIKARPKGIVAFTRRDEAGQGHLLLGIHVPTLAHRALAGLLAATRIGNCTPHDTRVRQEEVEVSWRLHTGYNPNFEAPRAAFTLSNNNNDPEAMHVFANAIHEASAQEGIDDEEATNDPSAGEPWPPRLRPEQARSLHWMLSREDADADSFVEEEVEEAYFAPLEWLLDVRATRTRQVWGGVVADGVGYGKTITTLALIEHQRAFQPVIASDGRIPLKATLILVTAGTLPQWVSEAKKFLGKDTSILAIRELKDLERYSVKELKKADIMIAAYPLLTNNSYLDRLAQFAALPPPPTTQSGRAFAAWLQLAISRIKKHVLELSTSQSLALFWDELCKRRQDAEADAELHELVPCKGVASKQANERLESKIKDRGGGGAKKRKLGAEAPQPSKETRSKLTSRAEFFHMKTAQGLNDLLGPPFELLEFQRIVVDEFTYLGEKERVSINSLSSLRRWILSGTPPLEDFADIKRMASFLGVYLGKDDLDKNTMAVRNFRKMQKERTEVEKFRYYAETRSCEWHRRRRLIAQAFLNQFVRKNMSSVKVPRAEELLRIVKLTLAERAVYTELEAWLIANNMNAWAVKRAKYMSDRDVRIYDALYPTRSGELGLLWAASRLVLDAGQCTLPNVGSDFEHLLELRKRHLSDLQKALTSIFGWTEGLLARCPGAGNTHYQDWVASITSDAFDDKDAGNSINEMKSMSSKNIEAESPIEENNFVTEARKYLQNVIIYEKEEVTKRFSDKDIDEDREHKRLKTFNEKLTKPESNHKLLLLRELTPYLSSLASQYVNGLRAVRYLNTIGFLHGIGNRKITASCDHWAQYPVNVYVLGACGHSICQSCLNEKSQESACLQTSGSELATDGTYTVDAGEVEPPTRQEIKCPVKGCNAHMTDVRPAQEFRMVGDIQSESKCFRGSKIQDIVSLITDENEIAREAQVIVFMQDDLVMRAISTALTEMNVSNCPIYESMARSARAGERIKNFRLVRRGPKRIRVLLLNSANESCAGSNLQNANHVIFVAPLHANSEYDYSASETQCLGRASRQGQKRNVKLYRFLTLNTIDVDILEARSSKKLVDCGRGKWKLRDGESLTTQENDQMWGTVIGKDFLPARMNGSDEEGDE